MKRIKKKPILWSLAVFTAALLVLWALALGNGESKATVLVLSPVLPAVAYGFVRLLLLMISAHAPLGVMRAFFWFFTVGGVVDAAVLTATYIIGFPNGLSPALGACGGVVFAALMSASECGERGGEERHGKKEKDT